jgi:diadenosine tetraphosphate (Ap4A) HIT family hydrolase
MEPKMECWSCRSNTGKKRISLGVTIYDGEYWLVEHAYPVAVIGWLVIVLKRHAEALHELTSDEFNELAQIQAKLTHSLFEELGCEKEYISCYAEAEHFRHIHFHVFAKPQDLSSDLKGGKSFALIKVAEDESVPSNEIIAFCEVLKNKFTQA